MSLFVKQFIATAIFRESQNNYCAFIKELNAHIKRDFSFKLPTKDGINIDFDFIESFMQNAHSKTVTTINTLNNIKQAKTLSII